MKERKIVIICDFDGTVASEDVGNLLFRTFVPDGEAEELVAKWKLGLISSRECLEQECARARARREDIDLFLQRRSLDPYFKDFWDFAKRNGLEVAILSDGLDYYIERMLVRSGVADVDFYANRLILTDHTLQVTFPYFDLLDCRDCGNCKKYHLERYRSQGHFLIYVGDGLSDRCPSACADFVFAKGDLLGYCRQEGITHVEFKNFRDVEREVLERFLLDSPSPDSP